MYQCIIVMPRVSLAITLTGMGNYNTGVVQIWSTNLKALTKAQALLIDLTARYISVVRFPLLSLFLLPL